MKQMNNSYQNIIKDYFRDFFRGTKADQLMILTCLSITCMFSSWTDFINLNWILVIPILFAMVSSLLHIVTLPPMMYLIPYNQAEREEYIQKMLYIKILIPLGFALIWDFLLLFFKPLSLYSFTLQIISILLITYICGTINNGNRDQSEQQVVYGSMWEYVSLILAITFIMGGSMCIICSDSISRLEFWIVFSATILIFLPISNSIRKRWSKIRSNFANYEVVTWGTK